jgi:hypothetical protein
MTQYWQLGQLIGIAVNAPKEYPKLAALLPKKISCDRQQIKKEAEAIGLRIP